MKNVLFACILLFAFGCAPKKDHVVQDMGTPRMLYVLNSESGTYEEDKLKLEKVHSVIYFSDRPNRLAGHMSLKKFGKKWKEDKEDLPNGALSILKKKSDALFELSSPEIEEDNITFDIKNLKGSIPKSFNSSALFIDLDAEQSKDFAFREDFHALDCSCAE